MRWLDFALGAPLLFLLGLARRKRVFPGHPARVAFLRTAAIGDTVLMAACTRSLKATWPEMNLDKKIWVIDKNRMKAGKEHRIPLSSAAIELLEELNQQRSSQYVFPGKKRGKPLSNMSMTLTLRRMDHGHITVHGFRSTCRDWIAEKTNYPQRVAETALAHRLKDGAEAAYQRGDLLEKRAAMMQAWSDYANSEKSNVVAIVS